MVKRCIFIFVMFSTLLYPNFKSSCVSCHTKKKISLRKTFMSALLVYSSEKNFKTALFYYCKRPDPLTSVMSEEFISMFLPLNPIKITDDELEKSIDEYWNRYKIEGKLK